MIVAEIDDVTKAGGITHQQYYRYWHGWQLLTNVCLFIGGIDVVVVPAAALAIAGSVCARPRTHGFSQAALSFGR